MTRRPRFRRKTRPPPEVVSLENGCLREESAGDSRRRRIGRIDASRLVGVTSQPVGGCRNHHTPLRGAREQGWIAGRLRELPALAAAAMKPRNPGDPVAERMMAAVTRAGLGLPLVTRKMPPSVHRARCTGAAGHYPGHGNPEEQKGQCRSERPEQAAMTTGGTHRSSDVGPGSRGSQSPIPSFPIAMNPSGLY